MTNNPYRHCRDTSGARRTESAPRSLFGMIRNTHEHNGEGVLSAYKDNAAVIAGHPDERLWIDPNTKEYGYQAEDIHILMKVETHNHPTAIAPFAGAATGSGGESRDEGRGPALVALACGGKGEGMA